MNKAFTDFLAGFGRLSETEVHAFNKCSKEVRYQKGDFFVRDGEHCSQIGFLITGITRVFHYANDKEFTSYFNFPVRNRLVSSFESFLTGKPSTENICFLENSELIIVDRNSLYELYQQSPAFSELGRKLAEYNYLLAMHRIYSLQHDTAQQRYLKLLDIYPELVNTVPHHYIASYLGITPESLSRLRKDLMR